MPKFLKRIFVYFIIPICLLIGLFLCVDPFKIVGHFSIDKLRGVPLATINREYVSTELLLHNLENYHYNSFIFGSSRTEAINSYRWKHYLKATDSPFKFCAWRESITGIYYKIKFLQNRNIPIDNVLIFLDAPGIIPGSFSENQEPSDVLCTKYYKLSGKSKFSFYSVFMYGFIKPEKLIATMKELNKKQSKYVLFDTITNDGNKLFKHDFKIIPKRNSINIIDSTYYRTEKVEFSKQVINDNFKVKLQDIKNIFSLNHTKFKIIISPDYSQKHINQLDIELLESIFGNKNVFDYSGKNPISEDKYNFTDIEHFSSTVGWSILTDIYEK